MNDLERRIREAAGKSRVAPGQWDIHWDDDDESVTFIELCAPANILSLLDAKNAEIKRLKKQVSDMNRAHGEEIRDMMRDSRDAIAEARWQERQGEDYGSY